MEYTPPCSVKRELKSFLAHDLGAILGSHVVTKRNLARYPTGIDRIEGEPEIIVPPQTSSRSWLFDINVRYVDRNGSEKVLGLFSKEPRKEGKGEGFDGQQDKRADQAAYEADRLEHSSELGCNTPVFVHRDRGRIIMERVLGEKLLSLLYGSRSDVEAQISYLFSVAEALAHTHNVWKKNYTRFSGFLSKRSWDYSYDIARAISILTDNELSRGEKGVLSAALGKEFEVVLGAYDVGLIHGDLHPGQIFLDKVTGNVCFVDLGDLGQGPHSFDLVDVVSSPLVRLRMRDTVARVTERYDLSRDSVIDKSMFIPSLYGAEFFRSMIAASHTHSLVNNVPILRGYQTEYGAFAHLIGAFPEWYEWNALQALRRFRDLNLEIKGLADLENLLVEKLQSTQGLPLLERLNGSDHGSVRIGNGEGSGNGCGGVVVDSSLGGSLTTTLIAASQRV